VRWLGYLPTSIPAITAIYGLVRKRVFAVYVVLGFTEEVSSGIFYNLID
jgi:hypothetical protein